MSDPLLEAARAMREHVQGQQEPIGRGTRARILTGVRLQQRRRIVKMTFGIPLAAILVGSGAWAASQPTLPLWVQRVADLCGMRTSAEAPAVVKSTPRPSAARVSSTVADHSDAALVQPASVPPESTSRTPSSRDSNLVPTTATSSPRLNASGDADGPSTQRDLDRYEAAHRLHFSGNDPKSALLAWNEYLRQLPHGRFFVEAKYNRAMCLIRLGRNREAVEALRPFAAGAFGNYRRAEAKSLCDQLEQPPPAGAPATLD